jgi:thioredoxin-dependent peroxiredoxin
MRTATLTSLCLALAAVLFAGNAVAQEAEAQAEQTEKVDLKVGQPAPQFEVTADNGEPWKSKEHYGEKIVVVYFYPAAMTGGCTRQACAFRDDMEQLEAKGVEVVGVSGDEVAGLKLFKIAHDLNFPLLADTEGKVAKKFGVPLREGGEITREIDGEEHVLKRGVSAARWTFVIDKDQKIALKNTEVNAAEDSKAVLAAVEKLQSAQ